MSAAVSAHAALDRVIIAESVIVWNDAARTLNTQVTGMLLK
ncbi:hypothetical protein ACFRQM_24790 [Streptomyces sp. NPDC056831]